MLKRSRLYKVLKTSTIMQYDKYNRATKIRVRGSQSSYVVIIRRARGTVSVECRQDIGALGYKSCQAAAHGNMCYHARHALLVAADAAELQLAFFKQRPGIKYIGNAMLPVTLFKQALVQEYIQVRKPHKGKEHDE